MNLKLRLNLLITALLGLLLIIGSFLLIHNARGQVLAEVESMATLATHLLDAETIYFSGVFKDKSSHKPFRLQRLEHLRHLRIEFRNAAGLVIDSNQRNQNLSEGNQPPAWFAHAMTVAMPQPIEIKRLLIVNGEKIGELVIIPDPSYEIAEIWRDTVDFLVLVLIFFITVNLMVYWAVGRALQPVDHILTALTELEGGNLNARLPSFELPEMTRISDKFNGMTQTLQQSINRNHKLSQQLIRIQEEGKRSLARDLHDELGQYLTAIRTDATTLLEISKNTLPNARESAQAIIDATIQVMAIIRAMLQKLRPEILDELGLHPALVELITTWRQRNRMQSCIVKIPNTLPQLNESVNITAYRVVQESLTNITKHAAAHKVEIQIRESTESGHQGLEISISDDGIGFDPLNTEGFGLSGMRERVEGLGGHHRIISNVSNGTTISVWLPLNQITELI